METTQDASPGNSLEATKSHALQAAEELRAAAGTKAQQIKRVAEDRAHHLREVAGEQAETLKSAAGEQATHLKNAAQHSWDDARSKADDLRVELEKYVRENPTKAILTTFGAGVLLGLLLRR